MKRTFVDLCSVIPQHFAISKKILLLLAAVWLGQIGPGFGQSYCTVSSLNCSYEYITNVSFAGINNSSVCNGGYSNFTQHKAYVTAGQSYPLSVTIHPDNHDVITVFIDWNQNGSLDDGGERYLVASEISSDEPQQLDIYVPEWAPSGEIRMRVILTYYDEPLDPCEIQTSSWGEAEDYTIVVDGSSSPPAFRWSEKFLAEWTLPTGWEELSGSWYVTTPDVLPVTDGLVTYTQIYSGDSYILSTPDIGPIGEESILSFIYGMWTYAPPFQSPPAGSVNFVVAISTDGGETYNDIETVYHDGAVGWKRFTHDLSEYGDQAILIRLTVNHTGYWELYNVGFDNFYVGPPVCPQILNPAASAITSTNATLTWSVPGVDPESHPAGGYEYYYSISTTPPNPSTAATGHTITNEVVLNDLNPGQNYYFWVRAVCSDGDKGEWSARLPFATELELGSPWSESFPGTGTPQGWNTRGWAIDTYAEIPGSQGNIMYRNLYNQAVNWVGSFTSPNITDILPGDELSFTYSTMEYGQTQPAAAGSGTLTVSLSNDYGNTYTAIETITNDGVPGWKTFRYALDDYVGEKVKIRIDVAFASGDFYYGFDDFAIEPAAGCPTVSGLSVSSVTPGSARISWLETANGEGYEYYYATTSTPPDADATPSGSTTGTFTDLSGLSSGTNYYFWVRSVCDSEAKSGWSAVMTFTTIEILNTPWFEGFSGSGLPKSWEINGWTMGPYISSLDQLSGSYLWHFLQYSSSAEQYTLYTPAITNIQAGQELAFRYQMVDAYTTPYVAPDQGSGNFVVAISTDFGVTYTNVATVENNGISGAHQFHFPLDEYAGETIRIRIVANYLSGIPYYMGLDDFQITTDLSHTDGVIYVRQDGTGNGSSWDQAVSSLQAAIDAAGVTEVWVAEGHYPAPGGGFVMKNNVTIYGGFPASGTPAISERNWAQHQTVLSGEGNDRVIKNVFSESNPLTPSAGLDGFIIENGLAVVSEEVYGEIGGGIYNSYASPSLTNLIIRNNSATVEGYGGGIYNADNSAPLLTNVLISNNIAAIGGGMHNDHSAPVLTNVTIAANNAPHGGSAMANNSGSHPLIRNSIIYGNAGIVEYGSFIYNYDNTYGTIASWPVFSNSIIHGSGGSSNWQDEEGTLGTDGGNNLDTDPGFVNPAGGDFSLSASSPALNKGDNTYYGAGVVIDLSHIVKDLAGNDRFYNGGTVDLGAYEFQGESLAPRPDEQGIIYVKTTTEGTGTGDSWENALSNLQLAIEIEGVQQVWVATGTYVAPENGFRMKNGVAIYGGFPGTGTPEMTQRNWTEYETILSGDGERTVINNDFTSSQPLLATAILDGFTISDGYYSSGTSGGIYNHYASPSFSNLLIKDNIGYDGGGIGNFYSSSPSFVNVLIRSNTAVYGGGISNDIESSPTLRNVVISGNTASNQGGGICNYTNSRPVLTNVTISRNVNASAGGIFNYGSTSTIKNSIIWGNGSVNVTGTIHASSSNNIIQGIPAHRGNVNPGLLHTNNPSHSAYLHLAAGSPAVNTGDNQSYSNAGGDPDEDLDPAGNARLTGGMIDMGAYESSFENVVSVSGFAAQTVDYGTELSTIVLPEDHTVELTLSNGHTLPGEIDPDPAKWTYVSGGSGSGYDANVSGVYVFNAPLILPDVSSGDWYSNLSLLKAEIRVTIEKSDTEITASWEGAPIDLSVGLSLAYNDQGALVLDNTNTDSPSPAYSLSFGVDEDVLLDMDDLSAVRAVMVGNGTLTVSIPETDNFNAVSITIPVSVDKAGITGIGFADGSFVYNGQQHSLAITGALPAGTSVEYTIERTSATPSGTLPGNSATAAGTYTVTATISGDNYQELELQAELTVTKAEITGIGFADDSFVYDGQQHSLAITGALPEGTSVSYTNNGRTEVGSQTVTATISGDNYQELELQAELTVTKAEITGISFADDSFVYDGLEHSLTITGTLPEGTSVEYTIERTSATPSGTLPGNSATAAGTYTVTATISGDNYQELELQAELTVTKAEITGIGFAGDSFVYNGQQHSLAITGNLPAGTSVSYTNNGRTVVGSQTVTATISGDNYQELELQAELTVTKTGIIGISFNDDSFVYNGSPHSLAITGALPAGTSVSYTNNGRTVVGSQTVTAIISGDNYNELELQAGLTVTKAGITGIDFAGDSFVYNGSPHSLAITGALPAGTSVSYTNNGRTEVGSQTVTAIISGDNYNELELQAGLTVTKAGITGIDFAGDSFVYNGSPHSLAITGALPAGTSVSYTNNGRTEVGSQTVTATISGDNYQELELQAELTVTKAEITGIGFAGDSFVYDGQQHSLAITGTLPAGTSVSYTGNGRTEVGSQTVTATISGDNYHSISLTATLSVTPASRNISFPTLPEKTFGDAEFSPQASISSGETIIYTSSNTQVAQIIDGRIRIVGAGTTTITATVPDNPNYTDRPTTSQQFTVHKAPQTINLSAPAEVRRDAGNVALQVSSSSGLTVSLSIDDPLVATLSGSTLQIHRLGTVTITATQPGNNNYHAATPVTVTVRVLQTSNTGSGQDPENEVAIQIHPAMSPNGDGINDFLIIEGIRDYPENKVTIFNRNGKVVWEATGYNNDSIAFDGRVKGQQGLPAGTYFYIVEVRDGGVWKAKRNYFVIRY